MEKPSSSAAADPRRSGGKVLGEEAGEGDGDTDHHSRNLGEPEEDVIHWGGDRTRVGGETADQKADPIPARGEAKPGWGRGNRMESLDAVEIGKLESFGLRRRSSAMLWPGRRREERRKAAEKNCAR